MITLVVLLAALFLLGICFAYIGVSERVGQRANRRAAELQRLRIQHEQFVAEHRMQQIVSDGLTHMLHEARGGRD